MAEAFDRQAVLARFGEDRGLLRQIAELFRDNAGPWLTQLRAAWARDDLDQVKRIAHTLKGSVGNFLAGDAAAAARRVQNLAASGETGELDEAIATLEQEIRRLCQSLDALLGPAAPQAPGS